MADKPRFLAKSTRSVPLGRKGQPAKMSDDEATGYTNREQMAMREEPEPVPQEFQSEISTEARWKRMEGRRSNQEQAIEDTKKQCRSVADQLREVSIASTKAGRDVSPMLARIQRMIEDERSRT